MSCALESNLLEIVLEYFYSLDIALGLESCGFTKLSPRFYDKPWRISQDMIDWPYETIVDDEFVVMHLVPNFSSHLKKVETLSILGSKLTDISLSSLAFAARNLKKLYIMNSSRITPSGIWNFSQYCQDITHFRFCSYGPKWNTSHGIETLADGISNFKKLEYLDTSTATLNSTVWTKILKNCPNLENIDTLSATDTMIYQWDPRVHKRISKVKVTQPSTFEKVQEFKNLEYFHGYLGAESNFSFLVWTRAIIELVSAFPKNGTFRFDGFKVDWILMYNFLKTLRYNNEFTFDKMNFANGPDVETQRKLLSKLKCFTHDTQTISSYASQPTFTYLVSE